MKSLGTLIRERREELGMSQLQLAAAVRVTDRQIRKYEDDEQTPSLRPVGARLGRALRISLDVLVGLIPPRLNLSGVWYAVWQTRRGGLPVIDRHRLVATQTGIVVLVNAVDGDYSWRGDLRLLQKTLRGEYEAVEADQHGTVFFYLRPDGEAMRGKWMGTFEDGPFGEGFGVLARSEELALALMDELIANPDMDFQFPEPEPDEEF